MTLPRNEPIDSELLGSQTPRILVAPPAKTSAADEAIELADSLGLILDPWQKLVLQHALGERIDGRWTSFEVGLCVPRQNGKSALIEARIMAGLLLFGEPLIVYSAHEFKTAKEIMRRVENLLKESGERYKPNRSHGEEGFELLDKDRFPDNRVMFQSRTKAAGRGLTGDTVFLDEAMILDPDALGALMPTLSARPNPQLWYAGSSVDQEVHAKGHVFSGVRKRARDRTSPRLCYLEWSCEEGANPDDPQSWAESNPSLGRRITAEYISDERDALEHTPKIFAVERLGIGDWPTLADLIKPPIDPEAWRNMANLQPRLTGTRSIALHRTRDGRTWSLGAAQRTLDGQIHVEIGYNASATNTEIVEYLIDVVTEWNPVALVIDSRSPAAVLKPYLLEQGIEAVMTNSSELGLACRGFVDGAEDGQISHSNQKILADSIAGAGTREIPGGFTFEDALGGTVTQLLAVTLAHWGLLTYGAVRSLPAPPLAETAEIGPKSTEFDALSAAF